MHGPALKMDDKHREGKHRESAAKQRSLDATRPRPKARKTMAGVLAMVGAVIQGARAWRRRAGAGVSTSRKLRRIGRALKRAFTGSRRVMKFRPTLTQNAAIAGGAALATIVARRYARRRHAR